MWSYSKFSIGIPSARRWQVCENSVTINSVPFNGLHLPSWITINRIVMRGPDRYQQKSNFVAW